MNEPIDFDARRVARRERALARAAELVAACVEPRSTDWYAPRAPERFVDVETGEIVEI